MKRVYAVILCALVTLSFSFDGVFAGDVKYPTPSYEGEDLAKLRQWEKTWAGKKITVENIDQVKDFLHESVYTAMTKPEFFGAKDIWCEIVPYQAYPSSRGKIAATMKYAPTAKIEANDMLAGYGKVAGIPFPQPKTGAEMAWNFDGNTRGDTAHETQRGSVIECRSRNERDAIQHRWELFWVGRYDVEPMPSFSKKENPRGIARSYFQRHAAPADFVDTTMLEIKYVNPKRLEDLWVYTAMFRRIRRYASTQRCDTIDGTDMIYDDHDGWYTSIAHNNYKSKGRADLLVARHQDQAKLTRVRGQGFWSGVQRERVNHWVVEVVNKDKNYIYSRQVWYLDPETWQMNFKTMYNKQGEFWKLYEMFYNVFPSYGGQKTATYNSEHIMDFIRSHGCDSIREQKGIGIEMPRDLFEVKSLKQKSY
jgi:hypothetical protein